MAAHILRQGKFSVEVIWCVLRLAVQVLTNSKFFVDFLANVCTFRVGNSIESRSLELEGSVRHISTDHRDRTGTDYLFAVMVPDRGDHPSRLPRRALPCSSHMSNPTLPTYSVQPKRVFAKTETGRFLKPKFGRNRILSRNNPISAKTALFLPKWSCICQKESYYSSYKLILPPQVCFYLTF